MEASGSLQKVLEAARALSPGERKRLRALLLEPTDEQEHTRENDFARRMLARGVLAKRRPQPQNIVSPFEPVQSEGKPASEIIAEERR